MEYEGLRSGCTNSGLSGLGLSRDIRRFTAHSLGFLLDLSALDNYETRNTIDSLWFTCLSSNLVWPLAVDCHFYQWRENIPASNLCLSRQIHQCWCGRERGGNLHLFLGQQLS